MAKNTFDFDDSSLLCYESIFDFLGTPEDEMDHLGAHKPPSFGDGRSSPMIVLPSLSEENFALMIQEEKNHLPRVDYLQRLKSGELDMNVRSQALEWILKAHSYYGFGELTLYLSMNYLDRFLSLCELSGDKKWGVQLLAVTCLSLGAKMAEVEVPSIIDLQVGAIGLVVTAKSVMTMELVLMDRLNWRMNPSTPYSFIDYFIKKMMMVGKENENQDDDVPPPFSEAMISKAVKLIISTLRGIEFLEFKSSEIAAAVAMEVVAGEIEADVEKTMSCFIQVEKERVMKCHKLLKDMPLLEIETWTGNETCRVPYNSIGVLEVTCIIISYEIGEIIVSIPDSPANSPDAKRIKID